MELPGYRRFVLADIPGLIEGAHTGAGLGDEFLRHIERTRVLVHMVDICPPDTDPAEDYLTIRGELEQYSPALAGKREIVVANKMDLTGSEGNLQRMTDKLDLEILPISAVTGKDLATLTERIWELIQEV